MNLCILGRDGIKALQMEKWFNSINMVIEDDIINQDSDVFTDKLGQYNKGKLF